ncbi:hypothetical protein H4Q26_011409 [Puccinia striiformis f. sp. tritici PST-130]|nr:hypothetical protein H4Q26_011409 [Puccinia striiformis f. sp. tritici PST-130]
MYDIHHGTPFDAKNTDGKASADANKIRVRDINFETLFSVEMVIGKVFNFAIEVDWTKQSLRVLHSVGDEKLAEVVKSTVITPKNPKVVNVAKTGEWHIQMIKEPLPNPTDKLEERSDVPHKGIQERGSKSRLQCCVTLLKIQPQMPGRPTRWRTCYGWYWILCENVLRPNEVASMTG